ncbi:hypothetical protein JCM37172_00570 [Faecalimonas hominis]
MGKKSFLLLIIALSIMVSGCGKFYNRDTRPGEIIKISMEEMETMMKEKETFTLVVTRDYCKYCAEFYELMESYLKNHHVKIYDVNIDENFGAKSDENIEKIEDMFPDFVGTPGIFYIEDGKLVNQLDNESQDLTKTLFDNWVQDYKMDKKK